MACILNLRNDMEYKGFESFDFICKRYGYPHLIDYEIVYNGDFNTENLEEIYSILNIGEKPVGFKGHSLSVGDIVVLVKGKEREAYYCDSVGFVKLDYDKFIRGGIKEVE